MMHLLRKYDVTPLRVAMMRCLPLCARRHTSLGEAVIIGRQPTSFAEGKHHSKNAPLSQDKSSFFCRKERFTNSTSRSFAIALDDDLNSTPCEPQTLVAFGASRYVATMSQRSRSNLRRLTGKRAFRLGYARLSAPRLLCKLRHNRESLLLRQRKKGTHWVPLRWRRRRDLNSRAGITGLHP